MAQDTDAASTVCAAFQVTAAADPGAIALRTKGGQIEITWGEYAERVRRIAAGLHARGLRRGDTLALMLTNRPEFHLLDAAAMHLGAVPFSIYNADLHVRHDRRPQGRPAARLRRGAAFPARRPRHLLPADGPHRRAQLLALLPDAVRLQRHVLPERARGHELLPRGAPVVVLRRAADLREAQGCDRVRAGRR